MATAMEKRIQSAFDNVEKARDILLVELANESIHLAPQDDGCLAIFTTGKELNEQVSKLCKDVRQYVVDCEAYNKMAYSSPKNEAVRKVAEKDLAEA